MNGFEEIRTVQVDHLASVWFSGNKGLGERIDKKVDSYANGESDHAVEAMTLLCELLREDPGSSTLRSELAPTCYPVRPLLILLTIP